MINLLDLDRDGIAGLIDEKPFRREQIFEWIFGKGVRSIDEMTNLSKELRSKLASKAEIVYPEIVGRQLSQDGTEKFLYRLADGREIESVLIPDRSHWTVCVSTQVGCAMNCKFCYTATLGFKRNLTPGEILAQVMIPRQVYPERFIRNAVFMGMGEPLLNYENVMQAVRVMTDGRGPDFSSRRITISTSGIIPGIRRLSDDEPVSLAISLNAVDHDTRELVMPINRKYPMDELMQAIRDFKLPNRRRITIEYVLLGGVNDSIQDAKKLVKLLHGIKAKVNLIPFNPWPGSELKAPSAEAVDAFEEYLKNSPVMVMRRREKGQDILAACGQLAGGVKDGID